MMILREIKKKLPLLLTTAVFMLLGTTLTSGQTLLGTRGGLEGSVTVDNTTLATQGAPNVWRKANANQTISFETSIVRSGARSLRILNTSTTGRRVFSPTFDPVADGSRLVLQYYRRKPTGIGQENQHGIAFPAEATSGTYTMPSAADTWEKVTYVPTSTTMAGDKWAVIFHRLAAGGDTTLPLYIDDVAVYVGSAVDNAAPNSPTGTIVGNPMSNSLDVSWTAAGGGTDGGGYLVVRDTIDPTTVPNVNGIYDVGNNIGTGTVVYNGTDTSFTDTGLNANTQYFYRVYTFDKAFNYSAADSGTGTTMIVTAAPAVISGRVTVGSRGASRVVVMLSGGDLNEPIYTTTNLFGNYKFEDITVGETYVVQVVTRRYRFANPSLVVSLQENVTNADFVAESR